jgi:hypothetical protein
MTTCRLDPRVLACLLSLGLTASAAAALPDLVVHGGVSVANLHHDAISSDAREGLAVGMGADLPLWGEFSLAPGIWYQQKGFKDATMFETMEGELTTDVISIPVLLTYRFLAQRVDPRIFAGLAVDVMARAEVRREGQGWVEVTDEIDDLALGLVLGGGVRRGRFDLEVRYLQGLTATTTLDYTVFDDVLSEAQEFADGTDTSWIISAGVWF